MESVELIIWWITFLIFVGFGVSMSIFKKYKKLIIFLHTLSVLIMVQLIIFIYQDDFFDLRPVAKYGVIAFLIYFVFLPF